MADRITIKRHTPEGLPDTGSFEIKYPDGRPSRYIYWDDNKSRRLRTEAMTQEQAKAEAKKLAREEQDKIDG